MYHCHIHFYLIGHPHRIFEIIKTMSPLENFTHEFFESDEPKAELAAKADVILADLQDLNIEESLQMLISNKKKEAELILLVDNSQMALLTEHYSEIKDIWIMPMRDEEIKFRFLRWQETCKMSKDFWQTSHYLEATINSSPNLIWYKDKMGIHEKVNDSFCKTVNKTKTQVEGRNHAYIWDVEHDDPACVKSEQEVMRKKKTCISGETIKVGDGERLLTTYKSPLYDLDGSVMGTVGLAMDITQERAYEQEIIHKNYMLETIFTAMDCGVLCHSVDGTRILNINRAALKILGYKSKEELIATGFNMIAVSVVDEDKEKLRKSIEGLKKEGDSVSVEYRVQHPTGEILHVMGDVKLVKENGELFYQRFLLDCTEQKVQEKRERERTEKWHMEMLKALSIDYNLVCFFDFDTGMGRLIRLDDCKNHVLASHFSNKQSLQDGMESYISTCVYEEDREIVRQAISQDKLKKELDENRMYYINYRVNCNGELRYFQMKIVRTGPGESSHGAVMGLRSVDEEIRTEIEKQNQLEKALLQANEANEAKSAFLSNMSHDIRTPMNAIVGFTTLALTHVDNRRQVEEYLKKIMTSGNHLLSLINDVLDMSRIESGKIQLEEKPYNLLDILEGLQSILQVDVDAKQLKLCMDIVDVQDEEVYCDKLRLNQLLLNLLSNAVKYTNAGGTVSLRLAEKPGAPAGSANYEFYVKDTGIGMSEEFLSHIFEPFERERNSTISGIQGTGLGMAITKNIVNMMNGSINVKSEQNVGTEIRVALTFRLCSEEEESQAVKKKQPVVDGEKQRDIRKKKVNLHTGRILLAEDIEINQEIAVTILEEAGYQTEVAGNGQIAVDMLKQSKPGYYQLVLMDIQMPEMNGYEATKAIRRLENKELASIPIIAMSANAFEEDRQEALKCGMNGHIAKPIDVTKLFDTLDEILDEK